MGVIKKVFFFWAVWSNNDLTGMDIYLFYFFKRPHPSRKGSLRVTLNLWFIGVGVIVGHFSCRDLFEGIFFRTLFLSELFPQGPLRGIFNLFTLYPYTRIPVYPYFRIPPCLTRLRHLSPNGPDSKTNCDPNCHNRGKPDKSGLSI